jgi:hypothetical protein
MKLVWGTGFLCKNYKLRKTCTKGKKNVVHILSTKKKVQERSHESQFEIKKLSSHISIK